MALLSTYLDHFKLVATAIRKGPMSEKLYKDFNHSRLCRFPAHSRMIH